MALTVRGRRTRYDNIASGSAAGRELTNADTVSKNEMHGGGYFTSTSNNEEWHSNIASGVSVSEQATAANELPENILVKATTQTNEIP